MRKTRKTKSAKAVELVKNGMSINAAARALKVQPSTVSRAWKIASRPTCPCCGQAIKAPMDVKRRRR